jgi:molybdopterin-guanine dinucleotide biosynthesis protein A
MPLPPLYGLVLAGGASRRMNTDKAALKYAGKPQLQRAYELLSAVCERAFVSVRADQQQEATRKALPQIVDLQTDLGPLAGIVAAQTRHPHVAWLVMACDLPFIELATLEYLIAHRDAKRLATAFRSTYDELPEPLCAIWEPSSVAAVANWIAIGKNCPRKLLINSDIALLLQPDSKTLDNVNTPDEHLQALEALGAQPITLNVQYFAVFREQAGKRNESLQTVARSPAMLYAELKQRYGFKLNAEQLKVAVNNEFCDWHASLKQNDAVAFIPPVAGG